MSLYSEKKKKKTLDNSLRLPLRCFSSDVAGEFCTCFLSDVAGRLEKPSSHSVISKHLACRINLLSWKATAWLCLVQFNNLNIDSFPHNLLFYKESLISQSSVQMELLSSIETTAFIIASPDFQFREESCFRSLSFPVLVSSVSIRKYLAFIPRGTEGTWPSKWPKQVPATSTLPLAKHCPLHGSVFCRPETYLLSLGRIPFLKLPSDIHSSDRFHFLYLPVPFHSCLSLL